MQKIILSIITELNELVQANKWECTWEEHGAHLEEYTFKSEGGVQVELRHTSWERDDDIIKTYHITVYYEKESANASFMVMV